MIALSFLPSEKWFDVPAKICNIKFAAITQRVSIFALYFQFINHHHRKNYSQVQKKVVSVRKKRLFCSTIFAPNFAKLLHIIKWIEDFFLLFRGVSTNSKSEKSLLWDKISRRLRRWELLYFSSLSRKVIFNIIDICYN